MPKISFSESALHDWVHMLTFQQQALLMTGMRGPDGCDKHNPAKKIIRFLRGAICKPAGNWDGANNNDFMWGRYDVFSNVTREFFGDPDGYPHHFIMHLIHCAEVIGYKHPDDAVAHFWRTFYEQACNAFHMYGETEEEMDRRLNDFGVGPASHPAPAPIVGEREERKYPIGGYAPGNYYCNCVTYKQHFKGDKRAVQCEPCAIKAEDPAPIEQALPEEVDKDWESRKIDRLAEVISMSEDHIRELMEELGQTKEDLRKSGNNVKSFIQQLVDVNSKLDAAREEAAAYREALEDISQNGDGKLAREDRSRMHRIATEALNAFKK